MPDNSIGKIHYKALDVLARREHSEKELFNKLLSKGYDADSINIVITKLKDSNLQSDVRFSESYTRSRKLKGFGPKRIILELEQRGVSKEISSEYIDINNKQWEDSAKEQLKKKFSSHIASNFKELVKMKSFLEYRGFNTSFIQIQKEDI